MTNIRILRRLTPLRRYTRPRPRKRRKTPVSGSDAAYRAYILTQPCVICRRHGFRQCAPTEGHHYGPRGLGQKVPDRRLLPLCTPHHRTGAAAIHVLGRRFAEYHGIDPEAEIRRLNAQFDAHAEAA